MALISPPITSLTLDSAPQKLWHEWLSSYFDGGTHDVGAEGSFVFPIAAISFDQGDLPQPLNGVGMTVVAETMRQRLYLDDSGRRASDEVLWTFYVRAKVAATGDGNSRYQARQAAELLRAILANDGCTMDLARKGISQLRVRKAGPAPSTDFALRLVRVSGQLEYDIAT